MKVVYCDECSCKVEKKIVALNKKLISRNMKQFLCINCLANYLGTSTEELDNKIKQFVEEGCELFI